jgi:hypothetical protein
LDNNGNGEVTAMSDEERNDELATSWSGDSGSTPLMQNSPNCICLLM